MRKTEFFLGANSAYGFVGIYDQLGDAAGYDDFIILKGGPGVGKSTFLKTLAHAAQQQGLDNERIRCSGDPDSLDGLCLPQLRFAAADGTAPHVIEPHYPGAVDRYLDLGVCYDVERLKERRKEIIACSDGYQAEYAAAYHCLRARQAVWEEARRGLMAGVKAERITQRLLNLWKKERPRRKSGRRGRETLRFLGGPTPAGCVYCVPTISALCGQIYELQDPYAFAADALGQLREKILCDGFDVIVCLSAEDPWRIEHLFVADTGMGFVTTGNFRLDRLPERRLHLAAAVEKEVARPLRRSLKLKEKVARALEEEALDHLRAAGEKHDELEAIYHPFVDFSRMEEIARRESERLLGR